MSSSSVPSGASSTDIREWIRSVQERSRLDAIHARQRHQQQQQQQQQQRPRPRRHAAPPAHAPIGSLRDRVARVRSGLQELREFEGRMSASSSLSSIVSIQQQQQQQQQPRPHTHHHHHRRLETTRQLLVEDLQEVEAKEKADNQRMLNICFYEWKKYACVPRVHYTRAYDMYAHNTQRRLLLHWRQYTRTRQQQRVQNADHFRCTHVQRQWFITWRMHARVGAAVRREQQQLLHQRQFRREKLALLLGRRAVVAAAAATDEYADENESASSSAAASRPRSRRVRSRNNNMSASTSASSIVTNATGTTATTTTVESARSSQSTHHRPRRPRLPASSSSTTTMTVAQRDARRLALQAERAAEEEARQLAELADIERVHAQRLVERQAQEASQLMRVQEREARRLVQQRKMRLAVLHATRAMLMYNGWIPWMQFIEQCRARDRLALQYSLHSRKRVAFRCWRRALQQRMHERDVLDDQRLHEASTYYTHRYMRVIMRAWRNEVTRTRRQQRALLQAQHFLAWRGVVEQAQRKQRLRMVKLLPVVRSMGTKHMLKRYFLQWSTNAHTMRTQRRRAQQVDEKMARVRTWLHDHEHNDDEDEVVAVAAEEASAQQPVVLAPAPPTMDIVSTLPAINVDWSDLELHLDESNDDDK